jgi:hypothetical protein
MSVNLLQHPNCLPAKITPTAPAAVAEAILTAYQALYSRLPNQKALQILMAQSALETGHWKAIWCYNLGNSKSSQQFTHTYFACNELLYDKTLKKMRYVWFYPPGDARRNGHERPPAEHDVQTRFRAFRNLAEGTLHHLRLVVGGRYAPAYAKAVQGDADGYSRELHRLGYYTAPVDHYTRVLLALLDKYEDVCSVALSAAEYESHLKDTYPGITFGEAEGK